VLKIDPAAIERLPPGEQAEARSILAAYEETLKANPLLGYQPHPKQQEFHSSHEQLKCFLGGNRSGKTTAGVLDDLIQSVDRECLPEHLAAYKRWEPPFYCRIIVPDFTSTLEGVIFQKLREWAPKDQLAGGRFDKAYDKTRRKLQFANGSMMDFLTFEQDLDKFGGTALHRVHYDEQPPGAIRRESMMRLIDYGGDELFTLTPLTGMSTWMFDEIWEAHQKGILTDSTIIVVDMDDNPYLDKKTKARALAGLSKEEREARKSGRFVSFAGMIYDDFKRHLHVIPEISEVPQAAKVYVGIDPGVRHMAGVVWTYLTPEDTMVVFDELALQGATVKQVCEAIKLTNLKWGKRGEKGATVPLPAHWYVIDPAARNVSHQTGRSDQMEYLDHGFATILGQNAVPAGISRVRERLQANRLLVTANCQTLIDEFRRYRWQTATRSEAEPKEAPVKADDHLLDALRYVVMSRPYANPETQEEDALSPIEKRFREDVAGKTYHQKPASNWLYA
jgi:phage terminase large subunit-like protein